MVYSPFEMDRALRLRISTLVVLSILTVGCQHHCSDQPATAASATMPSEALQQYILSGGVENPGPRKLQPGETISMVLTQEIPNPPGAPMTIVLIREAPEGKTRQLIQLNSNGRLSDPKQDFALRNGDEIEFPGGRGSDSSRNPTGH
jgi:hypothetical protein